MPSEYSTHVAVSPCFPMTLCAPEFKSYLKIFTLKKNNHFIIEHEEDNFSKQSKEEQKS